MAVSVTVSVLEVEAPGVRCPMALVLKTGTSTSSGLPPLGTPNKLLFDFVMATCPTLPTAMPLPSSIAASTLTAGDDCVARGLVTLKLMMHACPSVMPPDAAVSTSVPVLCVHAPVVPSSPLLDVTARLAASAVCDPVSPEIVTVDPFIKL